MTEVLQSSPSHFPSPSSSSSTPCVNNDISHQQLQRSPTRAQGIDPEQVQEEEQEQELDESSIERKIRERAGDQLSLLELLVAAFRRSVVGCSVTVAGGKELCNMEIGLPTNVRHVAHVTFDRFNGFLGLPVEFEPEVPRRAPSARSVFLEGNFLFAFLFGTF